MADVSARRRIWGWYFFDWASQPFSTLLLTFTFAPYFAEVARTQFMAEGMSQAAAGAAAQSYWGVGQSVAGLLIAVLAPVLGAIADQSGRRLVWVWGFSLCYVLGSWGVWYLLPVQPDLFMAMIWFGLGLVGMEFATIFTNALLPDLGNEQEIGSISGSGFAFGYLGGIVALVLMLLFFAEMGGTGKTLIGLDPAFGLDAGAREGTRAVGPFTAIWYVIFMLPFFLWVREPRRGGGGVRIGVAMRNLWAMLASLGRRRSLSAYLLSSMFYRDALNALYGFGGIYASGVLGWSVVNIGVFGIVGALSATLACLAGGWADKRWGPKPVIVLASLVLIGVCAVIVGMSREAIFGVPFAEGSALPDRLFYLCGALIGAAGGVMQASSRTLMVYHTRADQAAEAFGLYALSGKATAFLAPAAIAAVTAATGNQQWGIAPLIGLFGLGLLLLAYVRPMGERGA